MSATLVRKLLRATENSHPRPTITQGVKGEQEEEEPLASKEALINAHVQSLLALDADDNEDLVAIANETKKPIKTKQRNRAKMIVTNSRGSAKQSEVKRLPTIRKKRYKKEQQKKKVAKIAKLLKKAGKLPWDK